MVKKVWLNKVASFDEAQKFDTEYYLRFSSAERIEMVQALREAYFKSKGMTIGEDGKRLRRIFRIVKQE
jgi:hypothetical protein